MVAASLYVWLCCMDLATNTALLFYSATSLYNCKFIPFLRFSFLFFLELSPAVPPYLFNYKKSLSLIVFFILAVTVWGLNIFWLNHKKYYDTPIVDLTVLHFHSTVDIIPYNLEGPFIMTFINILISGWQKA